MKKTTRTTLTMVRVFILFTFVLAFTSGSCGTAYTSVSSSFETCKHGPFTSLKADYGTWRAANHNASIDSRHRSGRQSLRIMGGKDRSATFIPAQQGRTSYQLSFWAQRWTVRKPFKFRIQLLSANTWQEIYNGDNTIKVGRQFLSHVIINLKDKSLQAIRFICSSPNDAGVLIDDFNITPALPMSFKSATTIQKVSPVVIGKYSPVLQIKITTDGLLKPLRAVSFRINTIGTTNLNDIKQLKLFYTGSNPAFNELRAFGKAKSPAKYITFKGNITLKPGINNFWVACQLKKQASLMHFVDAGCELISLQKNGATITQTPAPISPNIKKRIAIALRDKGSDGVKAYRIPGLATTTKDTLIAVYDIRRHGMRDLPGNIDIGMSRSTNGGQTWQPMKVIMDMGPPQQQNGVGDPCVLVDRITGTIWVAALWSHGNNGWNGSGAGLSPEKTGQLMLVKSTDDGKTWSKPINITHQIKNPQWRLMLQCPGKGITMRNGTIVFPAQFKDANNIPHSTIIYSEDHGKTWHIGTGAKSNTTEAQVVELNDGSLMLNMRDNRGGSRSVYITRDMGKTWIMHSTSRRALPEPVCMASLIRFSSVKDGDKRNILLFSNPATTQGRTHITIKASTDEGNTWPKKYHKLIFEPACAGYSCMTKIDKNYVGILYEGGNTALLIFEKFNINEIIEN